MSRSFIGFWVVVVCLFLAPVVWAQAPALGNQSAPSASTTLVPHLIKFSGTLLDAQSKPVAGPVGVTFALYAQQTGGAALWMEAQNVNPDANGVYTILLGAESSQGVPGELFATGEARWLGTQLGGQAEKERVLLVSVPYALKAADAETLGGLPASAYAPAQASAATGSGAPGTSGASGTSATGSGAAPQGSTSKSATNAKPQAAGAIASNFLPVFTNSAGALGSSVLFQNPTSNSLGLGTMSPLTPLDLRLTGAGSGGVVSVGNQTGGGRFGVLGFSTGAGEPFIVEGDLNDDLVLGANHSEKMRITSAGNVGVGTSAPFAPLDVKGVANQVIVEGATSGGEASMGFTPGGSLHKWQAGVNGAGPGFFVYENGGGYRLVVREGGNVGIGTNTPSQGLTVVTPSGASPAAALSATAGSSNTAGGSGAGGAEIIAGNGDFTAGSHGVGGTGLILGGGSGDQGGFGLFVEGGVANSNVGGDGIVSLNGNSQTGKPGLAALLGGDVAVSGVLTAGTKDFKIDHPLDPAGKYLYHASVESSEMKNIYDGMVILDAVGEAVVQLPEWFEALNSEFRYQLTAVGGPGPGLYVAREIENNGFRIAGGKPGIKVSWQVTGIRQDAFAKARPLVVEVEKPGRERGYYIHPELYGQPEVKGIEWAQHPELMRESKARRNSQLEAAKAQAAKP
jgi:hypothetical protein